MCVTLGGPWFPHPLGSLAKSLSLNLGPLGDPALWGSPLHLPYRQLCAALWPLYQQCCLRVLLEFWVFINSPFGMDPLFQAPPTPLCVWKLETVGLVCGLASASHALVCAHVRVHVQADMYRHLQTCVYDLVPSVTFGCSSNCLGSLSRTSGILARSLVIAQNIPE